MCATVTDPGQKENPSLLARAKHQNQSIDLDKTNILNNSVNDIECCNIVNMLHLKCSKWYATL